ncbi:DUF7695 domain-containing protein [Bacillus safensis]|uniref:DUF7695 domain-containing protein n=1 Tax=Bacillus safensis TaxID=561879 RepID=UPI003AAB63F9
MMKTMKCKKCNQVMYYNYNYECFTCKCGSTYNGGGQELAPLSDWKDEWDSEEDY